MTPLQRFATAVLVTLGALTTPAHAQAPAAGHAGHHDAAMADGEVRKIDTAQAKLTLKHGPLPGLDMPPMTMVFKVADPRWLQGLKVGDKVRFSAARVDGAITVTALEPAAR